MSPVLIAGLAALGAVAALAFWAWRQTRRIEQAHPAGGDFLDVDEVKLHYRRTGPVSRTAVLVLHGAASNLEEPFMALDKAFTGLPVVWLDRPGLGWSGRPAGPWSPQREAGLIARFLDRMDIDAVTVVGHSWGGAIAMRLAIDHPQRVQGLVLLAPALSAWIGQAAWFNAASFWPGIGPLISRIIVPLIGRGQAAAGAVSAFHPEPVPEGYVERSALSLLLRPRTWKANSADMRHVNTHLEQQEHLYETLDHPTVFLAGKADTVLWSLRHGGHVARRMKRAEMVWISGAGHNLHHHHPQRVREAVETVQRQLRETGRMAG